MQDLFSYINWIAVFIGALGYFMLGAIWYSKMLFAKKWLEYVKIDINDVNAKKGMGAIMSGSFLLMFLTSAGMAVIASRLELEGWCDGLVLGLITGICFGSTAISISYLYEKRPLGLHLINGFYTLLGNIIAGIVICMWR